jgi:hypothetical protein
MRPGDYIRIKCEATQAEWQTLKTEVLNTVERLTKAGFRASFQHKPIYHHAKRLLAKGKHEVLRPEQMMREYLKSATVDKSGLNTKRLEQIGREALSAAQAVMRESS